MPDLDCLLAGNSLICKAELSTISGNLFAIFLLFFYLDWDVNCDDLPTTPRTFVEGIANVTAVPTLTPTVMMDAEPLEILTSTVVPLTANVFPVPTKFNVSALPINTPAD